MNSIAVTEQACRLQHGVLPAIWIPTDTQGNLLESEMVQIMDFTARSGVSGFMILGTTGEFPHLGIAVRKRVLEVARKHAGNLPILANVTDIRPGVVAEMGQFARSAGADAISLMAPYYYPLNADDQQEYFVRSTEAAQLPLFLYNFPERAGYRIEIPTIEAVADRVPLLGIKQSGADLAYHRDLLELGRRKNFAVITGSDTALPELLPLGVSGVVSGLSNGLADLVVKTYQGVGAGKTRNQLPEAGWLTTVAERISSLEFPYNIAATIAARGLPVGRPKHLVSAASAARFEALTEDFRRLYREWKLL